MALIYSRSTKQNVRHPIHLKRKEQLLPLKVKSFSYFELHKTTLSGIVCSDFWNTTRG